MVSSLLASRAPQCSACVRRLTSSFAEAVFAPTRQQVVRGKKTVPKVSTVNVRLLQDVSQYGPQGSIIAVPAGRMRNNWYPNQIAEYVTKLQLKELGLENQVLERDPTFGSGSKATQKSQEEEDLELQPEPIKVDMGLLSPERSLKVMDMVLPANIDFYRTAKSTPAPEPVRVSPSLSTRAVLSAAAAKAKAEAELGMKPSPTASNAGIFGSVSTLDIVVELKALLAKDEEGSRVVLSAEDITFVNSEGEGDERHRVKNLGIFEIDISVKGGTDVLRRTIKVNAQE